MQVAICLQAARSVSGQGKAYFVPADGGWYPVAVQLADVVGQGAGQRIVRPAGQHLVGILGSPTNAAPQRGVHHQLDGLSETTSRGSVDETDGH